MAKIRRVELLLFFFSNDEFAAYSSLSTFLDTTNLTRRENATVFNV